VQKPSSQSEPTKPRLEKPTLPEEPRLKERPDKKVLRKSKPDIKSKAENPKPEPERPDISIIPLSPNELTFGLENISKSDVLLESPKITLELWDLDLPDRNYRLLHFGRTFNTEFIRKEDIFIAFEAARIPEIVNLTKPGHRLVGWTTITCRNCVRTRAYWIHKVVGQRGWLWEFPPGEYPLSHKIEPLLPSIRDNFERGYFGRMSESRIPIRDP